MMSRMFSILLTINLLAVHTAKAIEPTIIQDFKGALLSSLTIAYGKGYELWYGKLPNLGNVSVVITQDMPGKGKGVLCYTGRHPPTVNKLNDEMDFIGNSLDNDNGISKYLQIHLEDGDLQRSSKRWCFLYNGTRDEALYDKIKELGWLGSADTKLIIEEGGFNLYHRGSGRVSMYDVDSYQQAAKALLIVAPSYMKDIYLIKNSTSVLHIKPENLKLVADAGRSSYLELINIKDIENDYYDCCYGFLKYTSLESFVATNCIIYAFIYIARYRGIKSVFSTIVVAFGVAVIMPHYLLPQKVLEELSPYEVPISTLLVVAGHLFSGAGTAMHYGGSLFSMTGNTLQQASPANSGAVLVALAAIGLIPNLLKLANRLSFGYLAIWL